MVTLIYSTTSSEEEAHKIARELVIKKLVACVNIIPKISSIYRWQGKIEEDSEALLIAKTTEKNVEQTITMIKLLHSYEIPDIVVLPVISGLKKYLDYIDRQTQ